MSSAPGMRDLALRLLTSEAAAGIASEPVESPTLRVYEKLRHSLGEFVGVAGFRSLATRALTLARPDTPCLNSVSIAESGSLQGLGEIADQFDMGSDPPGEAGVILVARLLSLLRIFLGEALTLGLLQNAWPSEALDERKSGNGRKA